MPLAEALLGLKQKERIGVINNNRTTNMRVDFLSAKAILPWKELTSKGYLVKEKKFPML